MLEVKKKRAIYLFSKKEVWEPPGIEPQPLARKAGVQPSRATGRLMQLRDFFTIYIHMDV